MSEYRTPEEDQAQADQIERIQAVLDQAVRDGVSCKLAISYGEPQDVVETWTDRLWDGLRDNLIDGQDCDLGVFIDDRLQAIILLLDDRMEAEFAVIRSGIRDVGR